MRKDYDDIPEFEVVDDRSPLTVQTPPAVIARPRRRLGAHTAAQLLVMDLPEVRQIVPGFFSEGLTPFGGKPKIGKSWLLAGTALALAMGGCALGSMAVEEGDVLLLALEDNRRRLKRRLEQLLPNGGNPTRLTIDYDCPRLDAGGLTTFALGFRPPKTRAWSSSTCSIRSGRRRSTTRASTTTTYGASKGCNRWRPSSGSRLSSCTTPAKPPRGRPP